MYRIISHRYPNNEIRTTFSAIPNPKPIALDESLESPQNDLLDDTCNSSPDVLSLDKLVKFQGNEEKSLPPLSLVLNSKTKRCSAGYGCLPDKPTKFGLNAKRTVIRSGAALEKSSKPEECLFLTGTLPGSTEDSFRALAEYSAYLVNNLKAWIANYIPSKYDFYVWEYQRRGALHLHYCIHAPDPIAREFILKNFRNWWINTLHRIGEKTNVDLFKKNSKYSHRSDESKVRAVAEVCRKSPARYLAKYLTKSIHPTRGNARFFIPSRWWGTSRPLKKLLESLTDVVEIAIGNYHAVITKLEQVKYVCDSSDSVTYRYKHKYGVGDTNVSYPNSQTENINLWNSLEALSTMKQIQSQSIYRRPSHVLAVHQTRLIQWLEYRLSILSDRFQGLKESLSRYLSMTRLIILLECEELPFSLMQWSAQSLDILSLLKSSYVIRSRDETMFNEFIDDLDWSLNQYFGVGWS